MAYYIRDIQLKGVEGRQRIDRALTAPIAGRSNSATVARRILLQVAIVNGIEAGELRMILQDIPERTFYRGLERLQAQELIHNGNEWWGRKTWYMA
ncbi:MAG: hypothetical protein F4Z16_06625 [Rhodothermaceae bacterium]|nr:hypothetical protein [Rhodothermaceae bacterium]MYD66841.1 hypothetical protein [Rhodothermaceae bacterium]MYI78161.1 hypothetical protein [Gammaproteobacteria bacterium]